MLMLDVVGSTHIAAELGDARYRVLSTRFDRIVRASLRRFGGKEEDHAGDGFFATFPQPDRAVRCAAEIANGVRELGIEIRAGIHTGQTEDQGGKAQGLAVVIGARVMSLADEGVILVTSTTKELVTGSGFGFEDLSAHELKGVPGTWQVFAMTTLDDEPVAGPLPAAEAAERRRSILPLAERRRPRRAVLTAVVIGALTIASVVAFALSAGPDERVPRSANGGSTPLHSAVVEVDPEREPAIVRSIPIRVERHRLVGPTLPPAAHPIVVGQGGVWSVRYRSLYHVDPSRSEVRARIPLEIPISFSFNLAEGSDKVWVSFEGGVIEVNPATHEQTRVIAFDSTIAAVNIAAGGRFVWVGVGDGQLIRFDPRTGRDVTRATGDAIDAIAFGQGSVWTLDIVGETLTRFDPDAMRPRARIPADGDRLVVGDSGVWVLSRTLGTLTRIDPSTNEPTGVVRVGPAPTGLAAGAGAIWVGDEDGVIRRVDEDTRQVTEIPFGVEVRGLAYDHETDRLWVDVA